jgi:hypothetical protein
MSPETELWLSDCATGLAVDLGLIRTTEGESQIQPTFGETYTLIHICRDPLIPIFSIRDLD